MSEFATTGVTEEVSTTPATTFAEVAATSSAPAASPAPAAKFVSASDLLKKTRDAEKETRDRHDMVYKTIVDDIVGDEENKARLMREMERSAERGYTKKVLRKFGFVPRQEGEVMPTHDEKGAQVVYEIDGRKYFLYSVLNKGGARFLPMLASRFGKGYWCNFYRDARDGSINIFVSWAPRPENTSTRREGGKKPSSSQKASGENQAKGEGEGETKPRPRRGRSEKKE